MARVNVEDEWFADATFRRAKLIELVGDQYRADGMAVAAWRLSQHYWKEGKRLIPHDVWKRAGLDALVTCDLAVTEELGVYVRGAKEQHDWLRKKSVYGKKGGKNSGKARFKKSKQTRSKTAFCFAETKPPSPSPSLTPSPTEISPSEIYTPNPFDAVLADKWVSFAKGLAPHLRLRVPDCVDTFRKLRELDGFTEDQLEALFVFVRQDDFWRPNALSPIGLRKPSKNGLRKIDNILAAMARAGPGDDGTTAADAWANGEWEGA
jgi:hypothetical protein